MAFKINSITKSKDEQEEKNRLAGYEALASKQGKPREQTTTTTSKPSTSESKVGKDTQNNAVDAVAGADKRPASTKPTATGSKVGKGAQSFTVDAVSGADKKRDRLTSELPTISDYDSFSKIKTGKENTGERKSRASLTIGSGIEGWASGNVGSAAELLDSESYRQSMNQRRAQLEGTLEEANLAGNTALVQQTSRAIQALDSQIAAMGKAADEKEDSIETLIDYRMKAIQRGDAEAANRYGAEIARKREQIIEADKRINERGSDVQTKASDKLRQISIDLRKQSEQHREEAKEGLGVGGQLAVDVFSNVTENAMDMLTFGKLGLGKLGFGARVFGQSATEAYQWGQENGKPVTQQQRLAYAASQTLIEEATEAMWNVAGPLARTYGAGTFDDMTTRWITQAVAKLRASDSVKQFVGQGLQFGVSSLTEALEEGASDFFNYRFQTRTLYGADPQTFDEMWSELGKDMLLGAMSGGIFSGVGYVQGDRYSFAEERTNAIVSDNVTALRRAQAAQVRAERGMEKALEKHDAVGIDKAHDAQNKANKLWDDAKKQAVDGIGTAYSRYEIARQNNSKYTDVYKQGVFDALDSAIEVGHEVNQHFGVPETAAMTAKQVAEQAAEVRAQNEDATVMLPSDTIIMDRLGLPLDEAGALNDTFTKLINGEELTTDEWKALDPANKSVQKVFTELTGVQFPGDVSDEQARFIYANAPQIMEREREKRGIEMSMSEQAERLGSAVNTAVNEARPNYVASYNEFANAVQAQFPNISEPEIRQAFDEYLKVNGQTDVQMEQADEEAPAPAAESSTIDTLDADTAAIVDEMRDALSNGNRWVYNGLLYRVDENGDGTYTATVRSAAGRGNNNRAMRRSVFGSREDAIEGLVRFATQNNSFQAGEAAAPAETPATEEAPSGQTTREDALAKIREILTNAKFMGSESAMETLINLYEDGQDPEAYVGLAVNGYAYGVDGNITDQEWRQTVRGQIINISPENITAEQLQGAYEAGKADAPILRERQSGATEGDTAQGENEQGEITEEAPKTNAPAPTEQTPEAQSGSAETPVAPGDLFNPDRIYNGGLQGAVDTVMNNPAVAEIVGKMPSADDMPKTAQETGKKDGKSGKKQPTEKAPTATPNETTEKAPTTQSEAPTDSVVRYEQELRDALSESGPGRWEHNGFTYGILPQIGSRGFGAQIVTPVRVLSSFWGETREEAINALIDNARKHGYFTTTADEVEKQMLAELKAKVEGSAAAKELARILTSVNNYRYGKFEYSISKIGGGFEGTIRNTEKDAMGGAIVDARSTVFRGQSPTREETAYTLAAVALNNGFLAAESANAASNTGLTETQGTATINGEESSSEDATTNAPATAESAEKPSASETGETTPSQEDSPEAETTEKPQEKSTEKATTPQQKIADGVRELIEAGKSFTNKQLFEIANAAYGGTMAEGKYTVKDAYDGMELAVNQYLMNADFIKAANSGDIKTAKQAFLKIMGVLRNLPTQSNRSEETQTYQQFSTPPNIAFVAAWAANFSANDIVLEPSAGIGGLALWPKAWGATVYGNELSERRLAFLNQLGLDGTFNFNAEQIDNMLPDSIKPTAVIMNPPFSSTAGRTKTNKTANAKRHIEQALRRLEDGGRLVAILGQGMSNDSKTFRSWWDDLRKEYSIRANISIDGDNYKKYGTTWGVQLVVIDKTGPQTGETITGEYKGLADVLDVLEGIRNDRTRLAERDQSSDRPVRQPGVEPGVDTGVHADSGKRPVSGERGDSDDDGQGARDGAVRGSRNEGTAGERGSKASNPETVPGVQEGSEQTGVQREESSGQSRGSDGGSSERIEIDRSDLNDSKTATELSENPDNVYAEYVPRKARVKGSKPHPAKLVESAAMAAVEPPDVTYTPNLPSEIVTNGVLSDAQLENVIYAGQAHEQLLPDGKRKGFFIGDGTGVGKGRQIAGIILDNFRSGRKKAVWISEKPALINDAKRDWRALGGDENDVIDLRKVKYKKGQKLTGDTGIVFSSYDTLKYEKAARIGVLQDWLGKDFDGVIVFDEAHNMGNATGKKNKFGKSKPSAKALAGIELQNAFPNARIVYASATGATEASNYAYLQRLGLWGRGTAFNDFNDFMSKISSSGLSAMELVARDMKAMGLYMARSISYDDVKYDTLQHDLSPEQVVIYNTMSKAWQKILQNVNRALEITGQGNDGRARGRALSQLFGAQQRFYNQILTSMSVPSVIEDMKRELAAGRSCVLQLVNTNAAAADRAIAKNEDEGGDLDDLDLTPSDILVDLLQKAFPVELYEEYEDENGNTLYRPVLDADGNPVLDKKAVAMRDALIEEVKLMKVPDGPLEMIFDAFGVENVAEVTGRTRRVVEKLDKNGVRKRVIESRNENSGIADANAFQDGKKRILIFSNAGGTGRSYHADKTAKNQQQRVHYLLQPGWEASKAVQGFGRTHRSNQASAPVFRLVTTNVMGQKRFISTIARRLDQLGALTKGQRQAGSGVFGEKDNLENPIAEDALSKYYESINPELLKRLGLYEKIYDSNGVFNSKSETLRDIGKFLNRILALEVDEQNEVFQGFYDKFDQFMDDAIAKGTVDMGLENYRADKIDVIDEKIVRKDPSGADTKYVQMTVYNKPKITPFSKVTSAHPGFQGIVRMEDGSVRAVYEVSSKTDSRTGAVKRRFKLESPSKGKYSMYLEDTLNMQTDPIDKADWKTAWNEEINKLPEYETSTLHLLTGTLLPIWDRLPQENTRVVRVMSSDGRQYLGRVIQANQIDGLLRQLNVSRTIKKFSGKEISDSVLKGKEAIFRDKHLKLKRSRVNGELRLELTGSGASSIYIQYRNDGVFMERISFRDRFFIPTGNAGEAILDDIVKTNPVLVITNDTSGGSDQMRAPSDDYMPDTRDDATDAAATSPTAQAISSADTSISQIPALFTDPRVKFGEVNIDIGGGKFDLATDYLRERGTKNMIFDPYNRGKRKNSDTLAFLQNGNRADTVTCANVLNVIAEDDARANVILECAKAIKPDGTAYFMVYEGDGKGIGKKTTKGWQNNRKTIGYVDEIRAYFRNVKRHGKLIIATNPVPNLPKALWEVAPGEAVEYSRANSEGVGTGTATTDAAIGDSGPTRADQWRAQRMADNKETARSLTDLMAELAQVFGEQISVGSIRGKGVLGTHNRRSHGIRLKNGNDFVTAAHEIGHHFDVLYDISDDLTDAEKRELIDGAGSAFLSQYKDKKQWPREGIAEFVRQYLTNRELAAQNYPLFTPKFLNTLSEEERFKLNLIADRANAYFSADKSHGSGAVRGIEEKIPDYRSWREKVQDTIDNFRKHMIDKKHGLKILDDEYGTNTHTLALNAAYADNIAGECITGNLAGPGGVIVGEGLSARLHKHGIRMNDKETYAAFGEYLVARNGIERLATTGRRVYADDSINNIAAMQKIVDNLELQYPEFRAAAEEVYDYERSLMDEWLVGTGIISQEQADALWERWQCYVPFRRMIPKTRMRGSGNTGNDANNPIKHFKGSGYDIYNPIDSLITQTYTFISAGMENRTRLAVANAVNQRGVNATFIERWTPPIQATTVDLSGIKEALAEEISGLAGDAATKDLAVAAVMSQIADTITQYSVGKASGNVISVLRNGHREYYKINDPTLYTALLGSSEMRVSTILKAYGRISRMMTGNLTSNDIVWSIGNNALSDIGTAMTYTPFKQWGKLLYGIGSTYWNTIANAVGGEVDPLYAEYLAMGGGSTTVYGTDKDSAKSVKKKVHYGRLRTLGHFLNPMNSLTLLSDMIERGPRYATYRRLRMGGMSAEAAFRGAMDITTDFRIGGDVSQQLNRVFPFFNANVQGVDRMVRYMAAEDTPKSMRTQVAAMRATSYLLSSALIAALFTALHRKDDETEDAYQQTSTFIKNSYYLIPADLFGGASGKFLALRKPRELAVATSFMQALLERFNGDEHAFDDFYQYATDEFMPTPVAAIAQLDLGGLVGSAGVFGTAAYMVANRDFLGRPIESDYMHENLNPWDRYDGTTSKPAYYIGQATKTSPKMWDFFLSSGAVLYWKYIQDLLPMDSSRFDPTLGLRNRYIKDSLYSTDVVNRMYERADASAKDAKADPANIDLAILAKQDATIKKFYERFNGLAKNETGTAELRSIRGTLIDMLQAEEYSREHNITNSTQEILYSAVRATGETDITPQVMNTVITDANGITYNLNYAQYYDYQARYNGYYWTAVEDAAKTGMTGTDLYEAIKKAKALAKSKADSYMLNQTGGSSVKNEFEGVPDDKIIQFQTTIKLREDNGESVKQADVIEILEGMNITDAQRYTLFHSKWTSDKNNPWA